MTETRRAITFVDTTLRDGQMSLWATNMTTEMILSVAPDIERAGFEAAEIVGSSFFKKCVRDLKEDPWERIRLVKRCMPRTRLRAIRNRHMAAFQITPDAVTELWLRRLAANGVEEVRASDPSNTVANWEKGIRAAQAAGLDTILNIVYSVSPKHTDEYYRERARAAARLASRLPVKRICLKDPGGLITPERTRRLVPILLEECGSIPLEFHTHCNTGLGPLCTLEAIKLGITLVNTAIPPLANGSSNPSVFNVAHNARVLGYETLLDEEPLRAASERLHAIARRYGFPLGRPAEYDEFYYHHQVPGGMVSNLRFQLSQLGQQHRLQEVLEETARVRAELGYPIMVTPYSQFVGTQAALNVITGERYGQVIDELILYALGFWGEEESASIDPDVKDRILARPRARELARWEPPQLTVEELRQRYGGPGVDDDEVLLRYLTSREDVEAMRRAAASRPALSVRSPLVALVEEVARKSEYRRVVIQKSGLNLRLERCAI